MNEAELKKAGEELKKGQEELKKRTANFEANKKEFSEHVVKSEVEFDEHVKETRKELEKQANEASKGISSSKGCYRDSKFWKSEEGIALKAKLAKK